MHVLLALLVLIAFHGLFVMAEHALVRTAAASRASPSGRRHYSTRLLLIHDQLEDYLLVCQIGKTMVLLGMGVLLSSTTYLSFGNGEEASWLTQSQFALWFVSLGVCLLVMGQELPKQMGINRSDQCAEGLSMHMCISRVLAWPLVWVIRRLSLMANGRIC